MSGRRKSQRVAAKRVNDSAMMEQSTDGGGVKRGRGANTAIKPQVKRQKIIFNEPVDINEITRIITFDIVSDKGIREKYGVANLSKGEKKQDYIKKPGYENLLKAVQLKLIDFMKARSPKNGSFTIRGNRPLIDVNNTISNINLKNLENAYAFLAQKFGDLIHDLGSIDIIIDKLFKQRKRPTDIIIIFREYIEQVKWLNPNIKKDIKKDIKKGNIKFANIENALRIARKGDKISEAVLKNELIEVISDGKKNNAFEEVGINDIEMIKTENPVPSIVFDQTSKGTGPNIYGQIINMFPKQNVTQEICLATFADKGSTQPASTIRGFSFDVKKILLSDSFTNDKIYNILSKYTLNASSIFTTNVTMGTIPLQTVKLESRNGIIFQSLKNFSVGGPSEFVNTPMSADQIKEPNVDITNCEHKTITDFNMISYAIAVGGIHSTGDTSAGGIDETLRLMGVKINFINEVTSTKVSVSKNILVKRKVLKQPRQLPINAFRIQKLRRNLPNYITNNEIQKLSNAFTIGVNLDTRKLNAIINKVEPGTIQKIIKESKNKNSLRSTLEKEYRNLFATIPRNEPPKNEPSVTNLTITQFSNSLKSVNLNNNKFIEKLFRNLKPLSRTNVNSLVRNKNKIMIGTLREYMKNFNKTNNVGYSNIERYLRMVGNAKSRKPRMPWTDMSPNMKKNVILTSGEIQSRLLKIENDPVVNNILMTQIRIGLQDNINKQTLFNRLIKYLDFEIEVKNVLGNKYTDYRNKYKNSNSRQRLYTNTYKQFNLINKKITNGINNFNNNKGNREKRNIIIKTFQP
jgi:hypothetical protein